MRLFLLCLAALAAGVMTGCKKQPAEKTSAAPPPKPPPSLVARYHFQGLASLRNDTNLALLQSKLDLPESAELKGKMIGDLARFFAGRLPGSTNQQDATAALQPLLEDLASAETVLEGWAESGQAPEWTLAVNVGAERAPLWKSNLTQLVSRSGTGDVANVNLLGFTGWQKTVAFGEKRQVQFFDAGLWVAVVCGPQPASTNNPILGALRKNGRPAETTNLLEARLDLAALGQALPPLKRSGLKTLELTAKGRAGGLRSTLRWSYAEKKEWHLSQWTVPTNLIMEPLISFTAAQGLRPIFEKNKLATFFSDAGLPNQLFYWSQAYTPFHQFLAFQVKNASNFLEQVETNFLPLANKQLEQTILGKTRRLTNDAKLVWQGLPLIAPFLRVSTNAEDNFLLSGLFPTENLGTNPPPPELIEQVTARTNLVYYDWEITQPRLHYWMQLHQLGAILLMQNLPATNSLIERWTEAVLPGLGNAITEISLEPNHELSLVRKSDLGLTGFELRALAAWAASSNFPSLKLDFRPPASPPAAAQPAPPAP